MEGWIKLYRSILKHRLFVEREVFDKRSAWVHLLLSANHKDAEVELEGKTVTVERGSLMTSIRKLSDKWKWSNTKVQKFLKECSEHGEIAIETQKRMTLIHILNYEKYQGKTVEIEIKKTTTLTTTKTTTENDDFSLGNTRDSEVLDDDLKRQLERQLKHTNNNKDKELLNTLSGIVSFLNEKAGTKYKPTVQKTKSLICARLKEGFTLDDFKSVIIAKVSDWHNDPKMSKYIRPETLFGTKFESYLQTARKAEQKVSINAPPLYQPTKEELERYARLHRTE